MAIALLSGPQDPSQLDATINALITAINGYTSGSTPLVTPVTAASTATAISPSAGQVTVNTTTRTAGTTGRYSLTAPAFVGQTIKITSLSTVKATITGAFERSKTKLSLSSTAALASTNLASVILTAQTTSSWLINSGIGKIAST